MENKPLLKHQTLGGVIVGTSLSPPEFYDPERLLGKSRIPNGNRHLIEGSKNRTLSAVETSERPALTARFRCEGDQGGVPMVGVV